MMDRTGGLPRLLSPLELPPQINRWPGERDDGQLTWIYGVSDPPPGGQLHVIGRTVSTPGRPGVEPGTERAGATPYVRWLMDIHGDHRVPAVHLLACVPMEDGEEYKRIYAAVARELGCTLFGTYHRPDWWSRTHPDWAPVWAEAAWVLHHADPVLPLREGARAPVYDEEVLHRLGRPGLTDQQWRERYHRLRKQVDEEWRFYQRLGPDGSQRPDETYVEWGWRVGWDRVGDYLLACGITPWQEDERAVWVPNGQDWEEIGPSDAWEREMEKWVRSDVWPAGTRVVHPHFGPGRVQVSAPYHGDVEYDVVFDSGVCKTLVQSVARMVREE